MVIIIVIIYAVSSSKNQNRGLPLKKIGDCPDPGRKYKTSQRPTSSIRFSSLPKNTLPVPYPTLATSLTLHISNLYHSIIQGPPLEYERLTMHISPPPPDSSIHLLSSTSYIYIYLNHSKEIPRGRLNQYLSNALSKLLLSFLQAMRPCYASILLDFICRL